MPRKKKKNTLTQAEQSERFMATARELEAAGKLNRTEAARRLDATIRGAVQLAPLRKK